MPGDHTAHTDTTPSPLFESDGDDEFDFFARGACVGVDPELFFPDRGESAEAAKAVCAGCAVRQRCLEYALDHNERHGIWGGTSERDRRRLRRQRRRDAA